MNLMSAQNFRSLAFTVLTALFLWWGGNADAITIETDLGSAPAIKTHTATPFDALNGTPLAGQTLSLDFMFTDGEFARLFTVTSFSFTCMLDLRTNATGSLGFADGIGYLLDQNGDALHTPQDLGIASDDEGGIHAGLLPFFSGELQRPLDFFGV